jgi:hypothetical protein
MPVSVITLADRIGKVEARIAQANGGIEGEAAGSARPAPVARGNDAERPCSARTSRAMSRAARANNDRVTRAETDASISHPCEMSFARARNRPSPQRRLSRPSADSPHSASRVQSPRPPPRPPRRPSAHCTCSESLREASRPPHVGPRDRRRPCPQSANNHRHTLHAQEVLKHIRGSNRP